MMEANQMRGLVQDIHPRSEINLYLKVENMGGCNDKARNKHVTATANTALAVCLVLS